MKKLNGNIYLMSNEIESVVVEVSKKFKTSHRAILPRKITYLDREFVILIQEESKNLSLNSNFLYGYSEKYTSVKKIIQLVHDRLRPEEDCSDELKFMSYDITDKQRELYRKKYENFLINIFLDECIKKLETLS